MARGGGGIFHPHFICSPPPPFSQFQVGPQWNGKGGGKTACITAFPPFLFLFFPRVWGKSFHGREFWKKKLFFLFWPPSKKGGGQDPQEYTKYRPSQSISSFQCGALPSQCIRIFKSRFFSATQTLFPHICPWPQRPF